MGCFSLHKAKRKEKEKEKEKEEEEEGEKRAVLSAPPSLKKAEWLGHANDRLLSSHPGYGTPQEREKATSSLSSFTASIQPAQLLSPRPMPLPHPPILVTSSGSSSSRPSLVNTSGGGGISKPSGTKPSLATSTCGSSSSNSRPSLVISSTGGGADKPTLVTSTCSNIRPSLVTRSASGGGSRPSLVTTTSIASFCRCGSSRPILARSGSSTTTGGGGGSRPTLVNNSSNASSSSRPTLASSSTTSGGGGGSRHALVTTTSSGGGGSSNNNSSSRPSLVTSSSSCRPTPVSAICTSSSTSTSKPSSVTFTSTSRSSTIGRPSLVTSSSGAPALFSSSSSVLYHLPPLPHLSSISSSSLSLSSSWCCVDVLSCLDWSSRVKIAMGVAQELAYLHRTFPNMVPCREFRLNHIQVDYDFSAKLSGYYSIEELESGHCNNGEIDGSYCPFQRMKSNVWSFGIVLLELMSGRNHMDPSLPTHERNLVEWALPFLVDEGHLFLAMDPKLHGKFPLKPTKMVAKLAIHCLHPDPQHRPTMLYALDILHAAHVQSIRCSRVIKAASMSSSSSSSSSSTITTIKTIAIFDATLQPPQQRHTYVDDDVPLVKRQHPTKDDLIKSPPLRPLIIPNHVIPNMSCSSMYALKDQTFFSFETQETF